MRKTLTSQDRERLVGAARRFRIPVSAVEASDQNGVLARLEALAADRARARAGARPAVRQEAG
ncbi:MAG: hypothetical protein D6763_08980 [Alphaproteobacteria bacterium]|nr:MAG: hypothetical protein D6763_08980 [Alphaproteobacteria bacterium]